MNIANGTYRGWEITVSLFPGTSGQIVVDFNLKDHSWFSQFNSRITDEQIRAAFNLPNPGTDDFRFERCDEQKDGRCGFAWAFMFDRMQGRPTQYEFLACLFKGLDTIIDQMMNKPKTT